MRIMFLPLEPGPGTYDSYPAMYQPSDGSFEVTGKDGTGMPPGKYRVSIERMKNKEDLFGGRYFGKKSPYVFDVDHNTPDLVIDLAQTRTPSP
jgi:hypothetical protein